MALIKSVAGLFSGDFWELGGRLGRLGAGIVAHNLRSVTLLHVVLEDVVTVETLAAQLALVRSKAKGRKGLVFCRKVLPRQGKR